MSELRSFTPEAIERIRRAVTWVERESVRLGPRPDVPGVELGGRVRLFNSGGAHAPEGAIGRMTNYDDDSRTYTLTKCTYPSIDRLVIVAAPIPNGEPGFGWTWGVRKLLMDSITGLAIGDYVGPTLTASWSARETGLGPLVVMGLIPSTLLVMASFEQSTFPPLYKATAAAAGGEITAKYLNESFAVTGDEETFDVEL